MRGTATFIGGPLDEQVRELHDLLPRWFVPVKDRVYSLDPVDPTKPATYGILEYRRTRMRHTADGSVHAVYELDL